MLWFFPEDITSALKLLKKGYILHSGGTGILMRGLDNIKGIISLEKLNLNYVNKEKNEIVIGSTATFSDIIKKLKNIEKNNILIKSLSKAASTPLRNRITIGGSIAFAPLWSDLLGPLITLEAKVNVLGEKKGIYSIIDFLSDPKMKKNSFIKEISFNGDFTDSRYFTFKRVSFDYSIFNISIVYKKEKGIVNDIRIALWGTKDKMKRLYELEETLMREGFIDHEKLKKVFRPQFFNNIYFSKEYLEELSRVVLYRMLEEIYEW